MVVEVFVIVEVFNGSRSICDGSIGIRCRGNLLSLQAGVRQLYVQIETAAM